ncbi:MAG: DUF3987 domain-containing protein [Anaerolineaceae bacterium]|nr:DUF3987 domain-containing protein [Anaerolineaceae bacterium]
MTALQLSPNDAYAFRRVLSKLDVPDDLELSPIARLLLTALDPQHNPAGWQTLQDIATGDHQVLQQIMYIDPKSAPPVPEKPVDELFVPPLPDKAQLDAALVQAANQVGRFHRDCAHWLARKSPMTPHIFLESAPLWAAGLAIARRCVLRLSFDDIHPNLYFLWVAPTTYYHKSTGLKAITKLVRNTFQHLLLPETTTPEMLMAKLAGQKPANYDQLLPIEQKLEEQGIRFAGQRGMSIDEASKILIPKKYMEGHSEALMQLFDAPDRMERELRGDGKLIIYNPALSLIGATTPAMLARYLGDAEWESGLMARILALTPTEKDVPYVVSEPSPELNQQMENLRARLLRIHNAFPTPPEWSALYSADEPASLPTIEAQLDAEVMARFNAYSEAMHELTDPRRGLDERLRGNYGRFPVLALKIALILAVMDWVEDGAKGMPRISLAHWGRAQLLAESYRASAHRLLAELNVSQDVKNEQKILDFIARAQKDNPPTKREIHRGTGIKNRKEAYAAVDALLESGVIEALERKTGGRPTQIYRLVQD